MTDFGDARILHLERLELRTLLAGGVFEFASAANDIALEKLHPIARADSGQPHEVARNAPPSARTEALPPRHDPARQSRSVRPYEDFRIALPTPPVEAAQDPQGLTQQDQPAREAFTPPVGEEIGFASVQETLPASTRSIPSSPPTQPSSRQPGTIDAAIASLASETTIKTSTDDALARPSDETSTVDSATSSPIMATDTIDVKPRITSSTDFSGDSPSDDNGLIDLPPLESFEPLSNQTGEREAWQLESRTMPSLRQIAESDGNRADLLDRVMQDWFIGPGGLISLDQVKLPAIAIPFDSSVIDVGLESTLSLHRSLSPVPGTLNPALSGEVLDAIMASIENAAASETQPTAEPSATRVSAAIYPAAAVVATTIAITTRRKHGIGKRTCNSGCQPTRRNSGCQPET